MNKILNFFFPKRCAGCGGVGSYFCAVCLQNISQTNLVCPKCERPAVGGVTHPVCERRFGLDGLWSLGVYDGALRKAVQKLKYKWVTELGQVLVNATMDYWARYNPVLLDQIKKDKGQGWIVVPVPLHKLRQNWRGFNQSALLGQTFAQKLGLEYKDCLTRIRQTKPQVGLSSGKRGENIKNAFSLNTKYHIQDTKILLVDDVWTTGSTLKECCYVLKKNGAKTVWALTLAR